MALGRNFHKSCGKDGGKVGENPAALRAAVFSLSSKNLRGGGGRSNVPPAGRGLTVIHRHKVTELITKISIKIVGTYTLYFIDVLVL